MFSGMVAAIGEVRRLARRGGGAAIELACTLAGEPLALGESVAVSGACLTVRQRDAPGFAADVSPETLASTTLGGAAPGARVNLERSLRLGDRLGGHLVLGHVDATVAVLAVRVQQGFRVMRLALPPALAPEVAEKGSVAVDGVSLTVAALRRRLVRGGADPRHAGRHDAGGAAAGRPRQPGDGRARQVRSPCSRALRGDAGGAVGGVRPCGRLTPRSRTCSR